MSRPLVAGNWKMNTTVAEGIALARAVRAASEGMDAVEVAVLPPFTHLWPVRAELEGGPVKLGSQDVFWELSGAFTGEISPLMLAGWCDYALVGHSERRHLLDETDQQVGRKFACAARTGLDVIVAVGETEAERDAGTTYTVIDRQLDAALAPFDPAPSGERFVVAYEPVWAIGTGRTATPEQAQQVCHHIKLHLERHPGIGTVRVVYGGSVTPENAESLFAQPDIDGGLIGGASLRPEQFGAIVRAAASARRGP